MQRKSTRSKLVIIGLVSIVVGVGGYLLATWLSDSSSDAANTNRASSQQAPDSNPTSGSSFNKSRYSLEHPDSIWVIVNKKRPLPTGYEPAQLATHPLGSQLRPDVVKPFDNLLSAAKSAGLSLKIISGYRSYEQQATVYSNYVKSDSQANADTYSARPGYSEHQTGLAVDLGNHDGTCDLVACFSETAAGKWLAAHAHEYGFIVRYPKGKDAITGYQYEPWHLRYVGHELAAEMQKTGQTMEEFFGLPAAPAY